LNQTSVLIIDDEPDILKLLKLRFEKQGYQVLTAKTGQEGLKAAFAKLPSLIILDLMLPDMDGLDVCKKLKEQEKTGHIPVMMLTAKTENSDEVIGLELGADDYVTKPFDFAVLHSRVKNLLKRQTPSKKSAREGEVLRAGKLDLDPVRHKVSVEGKEITLTTIEFRILHFFIKNPGRLFSRDEVLSGAWKDHVVIGDRAVDVHINGIRSKLKAASDYIETVRGEGYRFKEF
jgi:two-component system phosphate regulon response regulator PhoB